MRSVPIGDATHRLSEYVSDVTRIHDRIVITRHGAPVAILISTGDLGALEQTLEIANNAGALEPISQRPRRYRSRSNREQRPFSHTPLEVIHIDHRDEVDK